MGAGYSRGAAGGRISVAPAGREGQLDHFWSLGWEGKELEQGPSGKCQPRIRACFSTGPLHPATPVLHLDRCHFVSVKATAQAPSPIPRGQSLVKVPQCLLVHRSSSVHPFCPRRPVHAAGLRENPTRPLQWCRAPPPPPRPLSAGVE